jgi:hypothetical protein
MPRFAAIRLDHRHIYDLTQALLDDPSIDFVVIAAR